MNLDALGAGSGALSTLPAASLPLVGALLGMVFELDNTGDEAAKSGKRIVEMRHEKTGPSKAKSSAGERRGRGRRRRRRRGGPGSSRAPLTMPPARALFVAANLAALVLTAISVLHGPPPLRLGVAAVVAYLAAPARRRPGAALADVRRRDGARAEAARAAWR